MGVEEPSGVSFGLTAPPLPAPTGDVLLERALRYAKERRWEVVPGAWMEIDNGVMRCSCAVPGCDAPGAHPLRRDWAALATSNTMALRRMWASEPRAGVLLAAGRAFDILEVPETAGCLALARLARTARTDSAPGPVAVTPYGRMQFFVLAGSTAKTPELLRRLGWPSAGLDLVARGAGEAVAAPPTRMGRRGAVRWVCEPSPANRWLPDAAELMASLAYACTQEG